MNKAVLPLALACLARMAIATAQDKKPEAAAPSQPKVTETDKIAIREKQLAATEDQVRYASAILTMRDAKDKADVSQKAASDAIADLGTRLKCKIDPATVTCTQEPKK